MDSAFSWINNIMEWFGQLIPKLVIVRTTHGGVKFVRGSKIVKLQPGLFWYWPVVTDYELIVTARQNFELNQQMITLRDNTIIFVSLLLTYNVSDVVKALTLNWDFGETIDDLVKGIVIGELCKFEHDQLISKIKICDKRILKLAQPELDTYGITLERCTITELATGTVVKHLGAMSNVNVNT